MKLSFQAAGWCLIAVAALAACEGDDATPVEPAEPVDTITHRADIQPVKRVEDALKGVVIPPFRDCRAPLEGDTTSSPGGQVCTNVSIAGATEPGKSFARYASCDVVRTQRPYGPAKPASVPDPNDPRQNDAAFMAELAWAKSQIAATGCVCCHDSTIAPKGASQWDISAGPIWLDTISNAGLALFAGLADSSVLGAYPAADNHGFDRTTVGIPSTDPARMRAFVMAELERRGFSEEAAREVPPFGGPIYNNSVRPPSKCNDEGVDAQGQVFFRGKARYVYVMAAGSRNPGVPPNLDRPDGTLWRLDVLPSASALDSGLLYGTTPPGSYQDTPAQGPAPALVKGQTYQITALLDVGLPTTNCLFVYGEPLSSDDETNPPPKDKEKDPPAAASDAFGGACADSSACSGAASYCALQPGQTEGYCTATGCKEDASVCPSGWSCFDLAVFQPGGPSICMKP